MEFYPFSNPKTQEDTCMVVNETVRRTTSQIRSENKTCLVCGLDN